MLPEKKSNKITQPKKNALQSEVRNIMTFIPMFFRSIRRFLFLW